MNIVIPKINIINFKRNIAIFKDFQKLNEYNITY